MKLIDFLPKQNIFHAFSANTKHDFFSRAVAEVVQRNPQFSQNKLMDLFLLREKTLSTGIGQGVAIAHITYDNCLQQLVFIFNLAQPIDYESIDGLPVKIIFMIIGAADRSPTFHMQTLAKLALMLKKETFLSELLNCQSPDAMYAVMRKYD